MAGAAVAGVALVKPPKTYKPRDPYRLALSVVYRPEGPALAVSFHEMVLYLHHDGKIFRPSGIYYRGGPRTVFDPRGIPRWKFTEDQRAFVTAMMLGRAGLGPAAGFAA